MNVVAAVLVIGPWLTGFNDAAGVQVCWRIVQVIYFGDVARIARLSGRIVVVPVIVGGRKVRILKLGIRGARLFVFLQQAQTRVTSPLKTQRCGPRRTTNSHTNDGH